MTLFTAARRLSSTFVSPAVSRVHLFQRHLTTMPPLHKDPHRALLLLPPAPTSSTYASLKAAYSAPLSTVLRELRQAQEPALLEIALPCPHLYGHLNGARGPLYDTTQQLVADLYKLICIVAAKDAIDTEDAEGINARILLVAHPGDGKLHNTSEDSTPEQELQGPAIDLHTLAKSSRKWKVVYSVESEEGERFLKSFFAISKDTKVSKVRGGMVLNAGASAMTTTTAFESSTKHLSVAVGGTFDHLHIGHKLLLTMFAFVLGRRQQSDSPSVLTVGITGDALLVNKKFADQLESWKARQEATHDFLHSIIYFGQPDDNRIQVQEVNEPGPNGHAVHVSYPFGLTIKYVEIWDPFGPTITDKEITALALSLETRGGGAAVNEKRKEQGWDPLEVYEVAVLDASEEGSVGETFQSKLSSTEIRRKRSELVKPRAKA
ncbi:hypothetical protein BU25DRAFT_406081 [Macroventuria anomochaeta]|uniref:Uncharacterized protein n=1 Tax=Macroventuria anomochaeta TaxID=301207 RepID=A0ACB6SH17_9PLEO|nr:uncharacterized protein BU25DRAFT_406081 [Macroventuria anomochaeta]KAF2632772.1 hypothetical protein BU25DRAFT_406081 [Macroventuria anomochaeta]